jgi:hypothetical protein
MTDQWAEILRFLLRVAWVLSGLMAASFALWFLAMLLWHLHQYLGRVWFGHPW